MARKLFCELNSFTFAISVWKMRTTRHIKNWREKIDFAETKSNEGEKLPFVICEYHSVLRRKHGNVGMDLQEGKAHNVSISAPKINGILIKPNEVFSFWHLVGLCAKSRGYRESLTIVSGKPAITVGGGMCHFTNLIHWLVLHSPLDIVEHHNHDSVDIFPDDGRKIPFGCGTSIVYNYLDYRFKNNTNSTFQIITYTTDEHLYGELRVSSPQDFDYRICEEDAHFIKVGNDYYRKNKIVRQVLDKHTGNELKREIIRQSHAKVMYDEKYINPDMVNPQLDSFPVNNF